MKKIFLILAAILSVSIIGCSDGTDSDSNDEETTTFESGWYSYTTSSGSTSATYYFYYDESQELTRAGSENAEWTDTVFNNLKDSYGYDSIKDDLEFVSDESSLPSWATSDNSSSDSSSDVDLDSLETLDIFTTNSTPTITVGDVVLLKSSDYPDCTYSCPGTNLAVVSNNVLTAKAAGSTYINYTCSARTGSRRIVIVE